MPRTIPTFTLENVDFEQGRNRLLYHLAQFGVQLDYHNFLSTLDYFLFGSYNPKATPVTNAKGVNLLALLDFWQTFLPRQARIATLPIQSSILKSIPAHLERRVYWQELPSCDYISRLEVELPFTTEELSPYVQSTLGLKSIDVADIISDVSILPTWLAQVAEPYLPAMEYFLLGDLPEFFINLVYGSTGIDLRRYNSTFNKFTFTISATYGLPYVAYDQYAISI